MDKVQKHNSFKEVIGVWEIVIMRYFIVRALEQILLGKLNQGGGDGEARSTSGSNKNIHKSENLKGRSLLGNLGASSTIILKWILKKEDMWVWTGFVRLRIEASSELLRI
jgi:hypothetical protein